MTLPVALISEFQKLVPTALIELFILDMTAQGGDVLRFHAGTNGLSANVVWQGETYVRYPVQASGFEVSGQGQFPRPKIRVSNILSAITTLTLQNNDLMGAQVTRKRTHAKFLDAVNFPGGVNASADPTADFPEDIYFVDRKSSEDRDAVEFELASSIDLVNVSLPRRQIIQNVCVWAYRGPECGYTGAPLWDKNNNPIDPVTAGLSSEAVDVLNAFTASDAAKVALDLANVALTAATQAKDVSCSVQRLETRSTYTLGGFLFGVDFIDPTTEISVTNAIVRVAHESSGYASLDQYFGKWGGSPITIGGAYRPGAVKFDKDVYYAPTYKGATISQVKYRLTIWAIEHWDIGATCSTDTTTYTTRLATRDAAQVTYDNALDAQEDALAALPDGDSIFALERCGKRLSSCKLRFGANSPLPFGAFPAAGLTK